MKINNIKHIYIDLDDTLWDFTANSKIALKYIYDRFNLDKLCPDYNVFKKIYIEKNNELWELYHHGRIDKNYLVTERFRFALSEIGMKNLDILSLAGEINEVYLSYLAQQSTIVPGARELLEHLTQKFQVRILSNGFKGVQSKKLVSGGLDKYIHSMVLSDDVGITKPLPGIFNFAINLVKGNPATTLMIGDNYDADIRGAHEVGWKTIFFNRRGIVIENNIAEATVTSLTDIIPLI